MVKKERIIFEGSIVEALPNTMFKVELVDERKALCQLSGKMRMNHIKVMPGDKVNVELSPYDEKRGRIVYRFK